MADDGIDEGSIGRGRLCLFPQDSACALAPVDRLQSDLTVREVLPIIRYAQRIQNTAFRHLNDFHWKVLVKEVGKEPANLLAKSTLLRLHVYPSFRQQYKLLIRKSRLPCQRSDKATTDVKITGKGASL